ncbi:F420-0:gamma-L-glutamate ligase [Nitrososphaera viennensis EN76]|uniref:F420-0:gamma-L-glutamate ligase n=1 Tax=Nitrososphaera viennensis EN76 TaxID=926571 RepID=A0A060HV10_9ARCH|nr:F420-0:gamma-L-glutamate ligase [Nitrososphaera viennensis EN76]
MEILAVKVARKSGKFSLFESLLQQGFDYKDGDIIVVSSKFVSMAEGSVVDMRRIRVSKKARALAKKCHMEPKLAELVLRESDYIVKGVPGFLLAIRDGMIAPNAGIDKSNVPKGFAILYPRDPFASAEGLKDAFLANLGIKVGIVIADSRLMPTRIGTTGVAIACAGFEPVEDLRGKKDLFGNVLRVTFRAVADGLATMGVAAMGESDESTPAAVVRGARVQWTNKKLSWRDMAVAPEQDIYLRGLKSEL